MIKNIVFDFGDVFIDLNKESTAAELRRLGITEFTPEMHRMNVAYEKGLLPTSGFIAFYRKHFSAVSEDELMRMWNAILGDFPEERLLFLEELAKRPYRLFLLSNTNDLHITHFRKNVGEDFYRRFENAFEKVFYSYEVKLRKPDRDIFEKVIEETGILPGETLFIDDTFENIQTAQKMGFRVWHLLLVSEDIRDLPKKIPELA